MIPKMVRSIFQNLQHCKTLKGPHPTAEIEHLYRLKQINKLDNLDNIDKTGGFFVFGSLDKIFRKNAGWSTSSRHHRI